MKQKYFILSIFLFFLSTGIAHAQSKLLKNEDIWANRDLQAKSVQRFTSMKDGKSYVRLEKGSILRFSFNSGKFIDTLLSANKLIFQGEKIPIFTFKFSDDEKWIIIQSNIKSIYRHSYVSDVYLYNRETQSLLEESFSGVRYPSFSPDGKKIAFVQQNNLMTYDLTLKEIYSVTGDGMKNMIINGAVDWVYEEEFSMSVGYQWSPDSRYLAYYRFDESPVMHFSMDIYNGDLYPHREEFKYPKVGMQNSMVDIFIMDFVGNQMAHCQFGLDPNDMYLPRMQFSLQPGKLLVQVLNRFQNEWKVLMVEASSGEFKELYSETSKQYIDINDAFYLFPDKTTLLFTSEKDGYNQIYKLDLNSGKSEKIGPENFDVDKILHMDEKQALIYFSGTNKGPQERHLYSIDIKKKKLSQITTESGWHQISFAGGGNYYLDQFSTMTTPPVYTLYETKNNKGTVLENNEELVNKINDFNIGKVSFGSFKTTQGTDLNYWKILPPDFDPNKTYPLLLHVYGGPGSQTVKNAWGHGNYLWHQLLAQQGYIVISVDNRGTGFRGAEFKKGTYLNLGKQETEDQIEAAKYFGKEQYIDAKRIGIWGWSYGGFMSALCISKGSDYFKTAIAVAPVTHWKYYDNIYTERYMQTENENSEGYEENAPINHVDKIKGNFLIVHGTADDNVHFQHTAEMVKAMIEKNIPFESEFYPNHSHGISGGMTRLHLYNRMTKYILEKL